MTLQAKQSIKSRFIQYVLPSVAAMWVYTIYTMADGIFVARGVGEQALAAVNLCMPMINGAFSMGILFAVGASTKASIHKGRGDTQESNRVFTLGAMTVASIGLLATLFVLLLLPQLARLLGADAHTLPYVKGYLGIIGLFLPFYMTSYYLEVLVKADGFPKLAIKTSIAGAMTNIVLDAIFVLVFHWGIEGAAVATGLSQAMTFSIYLRHFLARRPSRKAACRKEQRKSRRECCRSCCSQHRLHLCPCPLAAAGGIPFREAGTCGLRNRALHRALHLRL